MDLNEALDTLAQQPAAPLDPAELALLVARDEYPQLDVEGCLSELAGMAHEARRYLRGGPEARLRGLCRYLFHEMGFRGNRRNYYDPRNSYLNQVLDRRTGIPLTLSLVAMAVGNRAGLTVVGIGLPGHFVAQAIVGNEAILFDPFHGGRLLTLSDCETLVRQATGQAFTLAPADLQPLPPGPLLARLLGNLKGIYLHAADFGRAIRVLRRLCQLLPAEPVHRRDLGLSLCHAGRHGQAITELEAYLSARPHAADAEPVRAILRKARAEVARWN